MNEQAKSILECSKRLAALEQQCREAEARLGFALFAGSESAAAGSETFRAREQEKEALESLFADVERLSAELREKNARLRDVRQTLRERSARRDAAYEPLGRALLEDASGDFSGYLAAIPAEIDALTARAETAETELQSIRDKSARQTFFGKALSLAKLGSKQTALQLLKRQIAKTYLKAGYTAFSSAEFKDSAEREALPAGIRAAFGECAALERDIAGIDAEASSLDAELAEITAELKAAGVTVSAMLRLNGIKKEIAQKADEQQSLAAKAGKQFADARFSASGEALHEADGGAIPLEAEPLIDELQRLRAEAASVRNEITLLNLTARLEGCDKDIEARRGSFSANAAKIERLQAENAKLSAEEDALAGTRESLLAERAELERRTF